MSLLYERGRGRFLNGQIAWQTDDIKLVLVDVADYTVNISAHEFLSEVTAAGRVATSANFSGKTYTFGVADADDVVLSAVTGDPCEALIIYKDTGVAATSPLIAYITNATGLAPVTPNGGNISVVWSDGSSKIFKL